MKTKRTREIFLLALLLSALNFQPSTAFAQGTAFTYQGRLNDGTNPATGTYDLRFAVYDSSGGPNVVAGPVTNTATGVSNGLFTVTLDFGAGVFSGANRWLEIAVRTNGAITFASLAPRQAVTPAPYTMFSSMAMTVSNGLVQNPLFLGTTANSPLELFAGNQRALRLEPNADGGPNVLGGSIVNQSGPGVVGATIAGGGVLNYFGTPYSNVVTRDFGTIAGGLGNSVEGFGSFIGSGYANDIQLNAYYSSIGGGTGNVIGTNTYESVIGGGVANLIAHDLNGSSIGGGIGNTNGSVTAVIGGGNNNSIADGSTDGTIGGGGFNSLQSVTFSSTIAGGYGNTLQSGAFNAIIAGGFTNTISSNAIASTISGGTFNTVGPSTILATISGGTGHNNSGNYSTIGGGAGNLIVSNAILATISGGNQNGVASSYTFIGGGFQNNISSNSDYTAISGGANNAVGSSALYDVLGGGLGNTISSNASVNVLAGGYNNFAGAAAFATTISGGQTNSISSGIQFATISGGFANSVGFGGSYSVVAGGSSNTNAGFVSSILGGQNNSIGSLADRSVIAGGGQNRIVGSLNLPLYGVISGGQSNVMQTNAIFSAIAGGLSNTIQSNAQYAMIPGGLSNVAGGNYSFAAGQQARALHNGTFVWADASGGTFSSSASNQFLIRAGGGVGIGVTNPSAALEVAGTIKATSFTVSSSTTVSNFSADFLDGFDSSAFWKTTGNTGTIAGTHFIGTLDNQPVDIRVNNTRAMRYVYASNGTYGTVPNVIGGFSGNFVSNGVVGAVIAGGGAASFGTNQVLADEATVSGGNNNVSSGPGATIGGGASNTSSGNGSTIAGGFINVASGYDSFIGGGSDNTNNGNWSAIGGGVFNTINGDYAMIPGGYSNAAAANFSFAAGNRAKANHQGAFVWADSQSADFSSTGNDQFLIRAANGVGINTATPGAALQVGDITTPGSQGMIRLASRSGTGASNRYWDIGVPEGNENTAGKFYSFVIDDVLFGNQPEFVIRWGSGNVGIGTTNPASRLDVLASSTTAIQGTSTSGNGVQGSTSSTVTSGVYGENLSGNGYGVAGRASTAGAAVYGDNLSSSGWSGYFTGRLFANGPAGIGRTPALNALEVEGNASKTVAGSWLANSDGRIKTDIATITNALEKLAQVRLVQFRYSEVYRAAHPSIEDHPYLNVVAQEFAKVFPDQVKHSGEKLPNGDDDILQVDTYPLTIYSAAAVQELNRKLTERDAEIQDLKKAVAEMKAMLAELNGKK